MILIIDDRSDSAHLTEMALAMLDPEIRTESVCTGEQALAFLRTTRELPALILLDLNMPGMNGIETLRQLRADERLKNIPVVIVTYSILESDVQEGREAGATGFIHKDIRLTEFSEELWRHIGCWIGDNSKRTPGFGT